jgi:cell wall-associated NlpC family hydrolase
MIRRALVLLALTATALPLLPAAAAAAGPAGPVGPVGPVGAVSARQDTGTGRLTVSGWAYNPRRSATSIEVLVYVDGHRAGKLRADRSSPGLDRARHITGRHVFRLTRTWARRAGTVALVTVASGRRVTLDRAAASHVRSAPGARIVAVAKRYVGRARYVDGGASPARGFDCSGYTRYVYAQARVRTLPHNAEGQRRMPGMRRLSRAAARPGDLVFYLGGGGAYHVAIYAGHGMQYAAATARDGIRYQRIWSSQVEFRTIWH